MNLSRTLKTIFIAGSVSGVLDIVDAFAFFGWHGIKPARVLQGIASGLLGVRSFRYGGPTVLLGALLHFLIAFSAAAIYYIASRKIPWLTRRPIISGLLYGVMIYVFMNGFVLPLSSVVPKGPLSAASFINGVLAVMLLVGLPISLVVWHSTPYGTSIPLAGSAESHASRQAPATEAPGTTANGNAAPTASAKAAYFVRWRYGTGATVGISICCTTRDQLPLAAAKL